MDEVTVKLKGWQGLDKALGEMPDVLAKRYMRSAVRAGGAVILNEARAHVPTGRGNMAWMGKRQGYMRRHISQDLGLSIRFSGLTAEATIRPRRFAFIVNWLERTGALPHIIRAGAHRSGGFKRTNQKMIAAGSSYGARKALLINGRLAEQANHPGFRPRPFIVPAFEARWRDALEQIRRTLAAGVARVRAKGL